ncbi:MAG: universal stress protein [Desulfofustis sp.]|nr:universal stress protein [Desulfofustis sp.]
MYQKVLVPLDGSELAECALSHVRSLVKDGSAREVTLLHIIRINIPGADVDLSALREPAFAAANKYLAEMELRLVSAGVKVMSEVLEANWTANTITEYAQKNSMDLIVMSTNGYTGLKKVMLGSVASGVLNQSAIPVLLIRPEACRL